MQAISCSMAGLEAFGDDESTFNQLIRFVLGKTCLAHVEKRRVGFSLLLGLARIWNFEQYVNIIVHVDSSRNGFLHFPDITLHMCIIINVISLCLH